MIKFLFENIIYIILFGILIYSIIKERQTLGCGKFLSTEICNNMRGSIVDGTIPFDTDSCETIFNKMEYAGHYINKVVYWNRSYIAAFIIVIMIHFIFFNKFIPPSKELLISVLLVTFVIYYLLNFYDYHQMWPLMQQVLKGIKLLKEKC